jgi:sugar fermentation stimulation protein A
VSERRFPATFLERPNRFVAQVRLEDGREVPVHVASSGRMKELLVPGAPVIVTLRDDLPASAGPARPDGSPKTVGRLLMARTGPTWVSVDTSLPGKLFHQAVAAGSCAPFAGYTEIRPEYRYGGSRIDFLLTGPDLPPCLVEVKSVTSALPDADGVRVARFPDAPTARGARHLGELAAAVREGYRAAVCFIAQRDDAQAFGPWDEIDPFFGETLRKVAQTGVEIRAFVMHVTPEGAVLGGELPVRLAR